MKTRLLSLMIALALAVTTTASVISIIFAALRRVPAEVSSATIPRI